MENPGKSLIYYLSKISGTWKVLENEIGPGKSWNLIVVQINQRASLGCHLLKQSGNKFRNIWHLICNACGYCIFVYSALSQVCWPWMTPHTIGSVAHVQYRASWKNVLGDLERPGIFSKQEGGNPG